jgi:Ca2+-dependent lipid-binding protein
VWATPPCSTGQYGSVELSLEHLSEERILSVTVHSCRGLRRIDRQGLSDPYVKVFLAPSPKKDEVFKTTVGHQTLAPEYHQMFMFEDFPSESLEKKSLTVVVIYRHDTSKDQPIGAINVPLYEVTPNKKTKIRKILNAPEKIVKDVETEVNKVEMSFSFDPQSCTLKVCINQAVIQTAYSKRYPNPYVTGYVCNCSNYITYALCVSLECTKEMCIIIMFPVVLYV